MTDRIYTELEKINPSVIVEAGGNLGQDTRRLCKMFPKSHVHTFEPIESLFAGLKTMQKHFPNLSLYQVALSDVTGTTDFYIDVTSCGFMGASSILEIHNDFKVYVGAEDKITVPCITLKDFMRQCGIKTIDLLWLDIEMMEYRVLNASKEILRNINYIYTEISYSNFRVGQPTLNDMNDLLISHGFKLVFLEPQGSEKFDWQANALYSHE